MTGEARKRALRSAWRSREWAVPESLTRRVLARALSLDALDRARVAGLYAATRREVPTHQLARELEERGLTICFPRVEGDGLSLHAVGVARLVPGYRGIPEPEPSAPPVAVDRVDVFFVPGVLFDREGRRLGRGSGHFDRLLAGARPDALRVGICWSEQLVDELPEEPWDVRMHSIVTERELVWVPRPGAGGRR